VLSARSTRTHEFSSPPLSWAGYSRWLAGVGPEVPADSTVSRRHRLACRACSTGATQREQPSLGASHDRLLASGLMVLITDSLSGFAKEHGARIISSWRDRRVPPGSIAAGAGAVVRRGPGSGFGAGAAAVGSGLWLRTTNDDDHSISSCTD